MLNFKNYLSEGYNGDGDCMEAAANLMMRYNSPFFGTPLKANDPKGAVLVHALVRGQGILKGKRYPHAWVEDGDTVIDQSNGNDIRMDKRAYYALGGVKPNEKGAYFKYTYRDMVKKLKTTGHYGHWDLDENLEETIGISSLKKVGRQRKRINPKLLMALDEGIVSGVGGGVKKIGQATANVTRVSWNTLKSLESVLDSMFANAKLDIAFTKHFWERINGSRGDTTISVAEIQDAFNKTYRKYANEIQNHPVDWKAIINDVSKNLNMPFTLSWDRNKKSMVMQTAMRKADFKSPDPKLKV
jgi:hypothetical protein